METSELPSLKQEQRPVVVKLNKEACRAAFKSPDTPATVLHTIIIVAYGFENIYGDGETHQGMDPLTLWESIRADFDVEIDEHAQNRLNALILGISTNAFYTDPAAFYAITCGLVHGDVTDVMTGMLDDISLVEIGMAMWELGAARGNDREMADAVKEAMLQEIMGEAEDLADGPGVELSFLEWKADIIGGLHAIGIPDEALAALV